jgi:hypothetical protein
MFRISGMLSPIDYSPNGLAEGNHRFQCCVHPWMRALTKVQRED